MMMGGDSDDGRVMVMMNAKEKSKQRVVLYCCVVEQLEAILQDMDDEICSIR